MRRHYTTLSLELFPVHDGSWHKDEEKSIAVQAAARARLNEFIRSGAAARLNDATLARLLVLRTWITRLQWTCGGVCVAMAMFFALRA